MAGRNGKKLLFCTMLFALSLLGAGCAKKAAAQEPDLMKGIISNQVVGKDVDRTFLQTSADFAVRLLQNSMEEEENTLVSPLSVQLALSMTANGAQNNTKLQMEEVLSGGIPIEEWNAYWYKCMESLPSNENSRLHIANSIWLVPDLNVSQSFLQVNADFYQAAVRKSELDRKGIEEINGWVKENTEGMIEEILDQLGSNTVMCLVNAVGFEAKWQNIYIETDIRPGTFTSQSGVEEKVEMMHSREDKYIETQSETGFIKYYEGADYAFVALLPSQGTDINDYVGSLTGERFLALAENFEDAAVSVAMPKFKCEFGLNLNNALCAMGMPDAFDSERADFSKMLEGNGTDKRDLCVDQVLHKTFIAVDEEGTRAGASTAVLMTEAASSSANNEKYVTLNRPFVYAIIDTQTKLPLFIGTVLEMK